MKPCLYTFRCDCKIREENRKKNRKPKLKKKKKKPKCKRVRTLEYPKKFYFKRFEINYPELLTPKAKSVLLSFKDKYIYYAIDDILYILPSNPIEQNKLLIVFYSIMLFLYYNLTVIFFDIWIKNISFAEIEKPNNFVKKKNKLSRKMTRITFNLFYKIRPPARKLEPLW